jgi:hypothetical protein
MHLLLSSDLLEGTSYDDRPESVVGWGVFFSRRKRRIEPSNAVQIVSAQSISELEARLKINQKIKLPAPNAIPDP